ncbi:MAG: PQQ-binding-like beta-propeller repeat protein [Chloroflexota bacterium]|nr:PQQ-binding-like beta-propeller repeat protein [Dehalococcoidia bacterium]MDW8255314.1 PQQ-binding-like beta-propeller repeat protein [Chloroflexota bacterium]
MPVPGTRRGPYQLGESIASTGLGVLYAATDETTGRPVVVKVLHRYFARDPALIRRLFSVLEAVRALPPHPHLLPPLEWGESPEGVWIAAPRAAGHSLERLAPPLPPDLVLLLVDGVAAALAHAHAAGIAHGNLKPTNVFYDPASGQLEVGDFGLGILGQGADPVSRATLLTPHPAYTAPECLEGAPPSPASDTFSLAALAWWLRTGAPPFVASSPAATRALVLANRKRLHPDRSLAIPPAVVQLVGRALEPVPTLRPPDPAAFAAALREAERAPLGPSAEGERLSRDDLPAVDTAALYWSSTVDRERWFTGRRWRITWRGWLLRLGLLAALIALAIGLGIYFQQPPIPPPPTSALAAAAVPGRWELPRYDLQNRAFVPAPTRTIGPNVRWTFPTAGEFRAAPASDGTTVYAATGDNRVVALDAETGQLRWQVPTTGPVDYTPLIAGDRVYVGLRDKRLLALDAATGQVRWEIMTGNPVSYPGAVADGVLYQAATDEVLFALDAATGATLWTAHAGAPIVGTPAVLDDLVVILNDDGWVQVLDRATGARRFDFLLVGSASSTPVASDDTAYVAIGGFARRTARLAAVDIRQRAWPFERELYFVQGVLWLWGILPPPPPPRGSRWSAPLPHFRTTSPALAEGRLFVGSGDRALALDQATGAKLWERALPAAVTSSPIVTADALYLGLDDGQLVALDPASGEELWRFATQGAILANPIFAAGSLFVASTDGTLYALR